MVCWNMPAERQEIMHRLHCLSGVIATLLLGLISVKSSAQAVLPHTVSIYDTKGISVSYPDGWSLAKPTLNSWVILNVPADQQDTAPPTVRVTIGYLERPDHGDAVSQLAEFANESGG